MKNILTLLSVLECLAWTACLPGCTGCGTELAGDGAQDGEVEEPLTDETPGQDDGAGEEGDPVDAQDIGTEAPEGDAEEDPGADIEPDGEIPSSGTWVMTIGDIRTDSAAAVTQTADGGILVAGTYYAHGAGYSLWMAKLDGDGTVIWQRAIGGDGYAYYELASLVETRGGDIIAAGRIDLFDDHLFDMWVVKLDGEGGPLWQKSIGGLDHDAALRVIEGLDGSIFVGGRTASYSLGYDDVWLVKLDESGAALWQEALGGAGHDVLYGMVQTSGGEIIVTAETGSFDSSNPDLWLLAFDEAGALRRQETIGGGSYDFGYDVIQARDGALYIAGSTLSFGEGFYDLWLLKADVSGGVLWQKSLGGGDSDGASSIVESADGGFLVAGSTQSFRGGSADAWIVKFDGSGGVLWQKTLGGEGSESAAAIAECRDGTIVTAGETNGLGEGAMDILAAKLTGGGDIPSCSLVADSSASALNTNAVVRDTDAGARATDSVLVDTHAAVLVFDDTPLFHCRE